MYTIKLFTSNGNPVGEIEESDINEALEIVKSHIAYNDTIVVISDSEYIDGIVVI
jgi:hypothetical protein